jgi:hypothetical protein
MTQKLMLTLVGFVLVVSLALSLREHPGAAAHSQPSPIAAFEANGTITKLDLARGRMWVGAKFHALPFAERERIATLAWQEMEDPDVQLLLIDSRTGKYDGSLDPQLGLSEKGDPHVSPKAQAFSEALADRVNRHQN